MTEQAQTTAASHGPLYDCGDPDCMPCAEKFGPARLAAPVVAPHPLAAAAMARRTKLIVRGLPSEFTCFPKDDRQEQQWIAGYRAIPGVTVEVVKRAQS